LSNTMHKETEGYTLGIDMGVASIGWGAVSVENEWIASGVRVFPPGVDNYGNTSETHLNQKRRQARCARRNHRRKAKRKKLIRRILSEMGWMPTEEKALREWEQMDVYALRAKALHKPVTLSEFGRILLHLNQRRGFLSLRKSEAAAKTGQEKQELEGMLGEISELETAIQEAECVTLGEYLHKMYEFHGIRKRLRGRHTRRQMLHKEFSLIWDKQREYHQELTDALRYGTHGKQENPVAVVKPVARNRGESLLEQFGLENLTFFQRKVYWPVSSIGRCELEPDELRAPLADRRFQRFRMLSELNNLRILDQTKVDTPVERKLTETERATALNYLSTTAKPTLKGLKKQIAKTPGSPKSNQMALNLEGGGREKISGLETEYHMRKATGATFWGTLSEEDKNRIVEILTLPEPGQSKFIQRTDAETLELLSGIPGLDGSDPETRDRLDSLLKVALPAGYGRLSINALEKLLPHMEKGFPFQGADENDSARHLAGYPRRDEAARKTFDLLPRLEALQDPNDGQYDPHFPEVNNPLVLRALHELRKVVNGVARKYGKPARIHVEMARDLKMSGKKREEYLKKIRDREKERNRAEEILRDQGVFPTRDAVNLFLLWEEQNHQCAYSHPTRTISMEQLLGGEVDIDHIYPRRTHDDSYMNKVVCFTSENRDKGDRLPSEWLRGNPEKFEALVQRSKHLPYPKRKRLLAENLPEDFAARDVVDTAYMAKVARHYLSCLVEEPHHVFCTKGRHTATLRKQFGLEDMLHPSMSGMKNRDDHRHHALDAIVTALCGPSMVQELSARVRWENLWRDYQGDENGSDLRVFKLKPVFDGLETPWEEAAFRQTVQDSLDRIWVSHRPNRKLSGPLHQEHHYGATRQPGEIVIRKRVADMTPGDVKHIRDDIVRGVVQAYLEKEKLLYPEDFNKRMYEDVENLFKTNATLSETEINQVKEDRLRKSLLKKLASKNPLKDADHGKIRLPSGIPIRKARIKRNHAAAIPLRANQDKELVIPGNTHHVVIFELPDGSHHFESVSLLETTRRIRRGDPVIRTTPPEEVGEGKYVLHLCAGDTILAGENSSQKLFVYSSMAKTTSQMRFLEHTDARDSKSRKLFSCTAGTFVKNFPNARKVVVHPNGDIRNA